MCKVKAPRVWIQPWLLYILVLHPPYIWFSGIVQTALIQAFRPTGWFNLRVKNNWKDGWNKNICYVSWAVYHTLSNCPCCCFCPEYQSTRRSINQSISQLIVFGHVFLPQYECFVFFGLLLKSSCMKFGVLSGNNIHHKAWTFQVSRFFLFQL